MQNNIEKNNAATDENAKMPNRDPQEGSKSDPQLTELDGLKKGGKDPKVNPEDEAVDSKGNKES